MKRVQRSKQPSVRQMLNMASNLMEKYNKYATVDIQAKAYNSTKAIRSEFSIYVEDTNHYMDLTSWSKCQDKYFELMSND